MGKLPRHRPLSRTQSFPLPHGALQHHFLDKQQVQLGKVGQGLPWGWERDWCRAWGVWGAYGAGTGYRAAVGWIVGSCGASGGYRVRMECGANVGWLWGIGWIWGGYGVDVG